MVSPPRDEAELLRRCAELANKSVASIAAELGHGVPVHLRGHKGWVGNLLEQRLGTSAGTRSAPDFEALGVELKTLPVDRRGKPLESTYVCTVPLQCLDEPEWELSAVYKKLRRVLWLPVLAEREIAIAERIVGTAVLWSPDEREERLLETDWRAHMEAVRGGFVESIRGTDGAVLQIRPKAADSRVTTWGTDSEGQAIRTNPRGFYLRARFTGDILRRRLVVRAR